MTAWNPRRIPIVFDPLPGEALDSWIEAYARRLRCSSTEFLHHLGVSASLPRMLVALTAQEKARLSEATGICDAVLREMTLERFDGLAVTIRPGSRGLALPPNWRRMAGSRFCPPCLRETGGRWSLSWRLPWSFACLRHQALLVEICPSCQVRPIPRGPARAGAWPPGLCTGLKVQRRHGKREYCGCVLTGILPVPLLADGSVLDAQRYVDAHLNLDGRLADPGREAAEHALAELFTLARRSLSALHGTMELPHVVRDVVAECGGALPRLLQFLDAEDAHAVAIGAGVAVIAHRQDDPRRGQVLDWIVAAGITTLSTSTSREIGQLLRPWRPVQPPLMGRVLAAMGPYMQPGVKLRYAAGSPAPALPTQTAADTRRRAAMIPTALWPSWSMRLLRGTATSIIMRPYSFRSALSVMLLLPGTLMTYRELSALLNGPAHQPSIKTIVGTFDEARLAAAFSTLSQLAYSLDRFGSPIDYHRRRTLVAAERPRIDQAAYERVCARHGWLRSSPDRLALLEGYLIYLLTGAPPTTAGRADPSGEARARWNTLRYRMPVQLREFLKDQAGTILARHRIDEPLQWDPPVEWVGGTGLWPGCDPEGVDSERFRAVAARGAGIAQMAREVGMNPEHIRLHMDLTGVTAPAPTDPAGPRARTARVPHQGVLEPDRLRELYEDQKLSFQRIADLAGCSQTVVSEAVVLAGITTRPAHRQRELPITRDWLELEYIVKDKTVAEIAAQLGTSRSRIARYAAEWGIAARPRGYVPDPLTRAGLRGTLAPELEAAFTGQKAIQRVRRVIELSGYRSIQAAAKATGIHALSTQLLHVERAIGFPIYERSVMPLGPTVRGRAFIRSAKQLLAELDRHDGSSPGKSE